MCGTGPAPALAALTAMLGNGGSQNFTLSFQCMGSPLLAPICKFRSNNRGWSCLQSSLILTHPNACPSAQLVSYLILASLTRARTDPRV
jgi:hypothetical protein